MPPASGLLFILLAKTNVLHDMNNSPSCASWSQIASSQAHFFLHSHFQRQLRSCHSYRTTCDCARRGGVGGGHGMTWVREGKRELLRCSQALSSVL